MHGKCTHFKLVVVSKEFMVHLMDNNILLLLRINSISKNSVNMCICACARMNMCVHHYEGLCMS